MPASPSRRRARDVLAYACALVHGVEDLLAAAFGADPGFPAARIAQRLGHARGDEIGAQLDGEGHAAAAFGERGGEFVHPVDAESEDVIGKPDVVGPIVPARWIISAATLARRALQVSIAPDRLRAPVAAEGAAARGGHVQAEVAMRARHTRRYFSMSTRSQAGSAT